LDPARAVQGLTPEGVSYSGALGGAEAPQSKEVLYTFACDVGEHGEGERGDGKGYGGDQE
jgi:hypothetical protein